MNRLHLVAVVALATATLACGCSSDPKPDPKLASSGATASDANQKAAQGAKDDTASPSSGSIHIDEKIQKACGKLPTAHFSFDSVAVQGNAAAALDALALCFVSGPLKGRGMKLIGHADARGETTYNFGLGQRRAGSVADYIATKGVDKSRLLASSRGELDATGTDEAGWARDRKVLVLLGE